MFLDAFADALDDDEFEEKPVFIEEFVASPDYLDMNGVILSREQYAIIKMSTQIYRKETLIKLYGEEQGLARWKETFNEVIMMLGKGSGKDFSSTIACAYLVYLLLCLKDPQAYYSKPAGNNIDIINIAINADQANRVFFGEMVQRVKNSPWFQGKYDSNGNGEPARNGEIKFNKNINLYSGHSEREAFEGYNVIMVILDEIAGFAVDNASGNKQAKTADQVYDMYAASVDSRFPDNGKLLLLSFPRFKGDFITRRYDQVLDPAKGGMKETILKSETLKIDEDLPDGTEGNEVVIQWEHDLIHRYAEPGVFAMKRATWEVNPTKNIKNYLRRFLSNPVDMLSRFACMPPDAVDAFFKSREAIEDAFALSNGVTDDGVFKPDFLPKDGVSYYVHVDLSKKHDRCAVAISHVDSWKQIKIGDTYEETAPVVKVDAVRWWSPTSERNVDFGEVRNYIISLRQRGFDIKLVTFDRWRSDDIIKELQEAGMRAEVLSVAKKHYQDLAMLVGERRIIGPNIEILITELLELRITRDDKVDHPRKGYKDLSDAVCGSTFNAIANTSRRAEEIVEIHNLTSYNQIRPEAKVDQSEQTGVITAPKRKMPSAVEDYLRGMSIL